MRTLLGRLLLFSLLITPFFAQAQARPRKKSPRAVAVLQFDAKGVGHLLPVSLFMDGKFYDAGLYMSRPAPLVLDYDTVYEAMRSGVGQGLFTVQGAGHSGKVWWGEGKWKAYSADRIAGKSPSSEAAEAKGKEEIIIGEPDRPTLKRKNRSKDSKGSDTAKDSSAPKDTPPPPKDDDDPDRPVLKKPKQDAKSDDGSVTIQTEKGSKETTNITPRKEDAPPPDDPDRPLLHRGMPAKQEAEKTGTEPTLIVAHRTGMENFVAAVSDPDVLTSRPYSYVWNDDDKLRYTAQIKAMAAEELRRAAAMHHFTVPPLPVAKPADGKASKSKVAASKSAKAKPAPAKDVAPPPDPLVDALTDVSLATFDLDYNNSPQLILMARWKPPVESLSLPDASAIAQRDGIAITVVARVNFEGKLQKAHASVSDPRDLEAYPELNFIDAVDVDGDGRAELLFQRVEGTGRSFVIYRMIGAALTEMFATAPR